MKKQIIRYGIGIDMAKNNFAICFKALDSDDKDTIKGSHTFSNTAKGFAEAGAWIEHKRKDKSLPCWIVMEVTGSYHENLIHYLYNAGFQVSLPQSKRVKSYLKSIGHNSKNDKADARGIASMALFQRLDAWQPTSTELHQLRQLVRHRNRLMVNKVALKNQLHAYLHGHCPEPLVGRSLEAHIKRLKVEIAQLEEEIKTRLKADVKLWKKVKQIIDSLPGVGLVTIASILAETDGFSFIQSAKQLTKYAGYDIVENQSGKYRGKTRISKQGNARLRTAMYMPALCVIRTKKGPLYKLYIRLLKRNGGLKKKALCAVQRKLLCLVYSLWKSGEAYDPNYQPMKPEKRNPQGLKKSSPEVTSKLHGIDQTVAELPTAIT